MQCHIVKNTVLHIAFSAILPAGYGGKPTKETEKSVFELWSMNYRGLSYRDVTAFNLTGKIAVWRSVLLTIQNCSMNAYSTKTHSSAFLPVG